MGSLAAATALQLFRVWLAASQNLDNNILGPSLQHQIYAAGFALSILLYSIGLILMATEMLRACSRDVSGNSRMNSSPPKRPSRSF